MSDDPHAFLSVSRSVWGWGTEREPPIIVWRAGEEEAMFSSATAWRHIDTPRYVAYHTETATMFLGGEQDDTPLTIASGDGGETWVQVGSMSGRLYFLGGHEALYMQTDDGLYTLPLPTATSDRAQLPAIWGALKGVHAQ